MIVMGYINGVATQIQPLEERAILVHCFAHCLNLVLQDSAKKCDSIRNALDIVIEICKLIKQSPKLTVVFEH